MHQPALWINFGGDQLHCLKWGSGKKALLAFHGYGDDATAFRKFEPELGELYTIYSIDLPHHGKSEWKSGQKLTPGHLEQVLQVVMGEMDVAKISLLGYSMGGRICLSIVQTCPGQIDTVTLLASDGLSRDFYYYFFTRTYVGKQLFTSYFSYPEWYNSWVNLMKTMGFLDESRYKFVMHYLAEEKARMQLQQAWPVVSELLPDTDELKKTIQEYRITMHIFMGQYDRIIPLKYAEEFCKGLETARLHVLEKGHRLITSDNIAAVAKTFF